MDYVSNSLKLNQTGEFPIALDINQKESISEISNIGEESIKSTTNNSNVSKDLSAIKVTRDSLQEGLKSAKLNERKVVFDTLQKKSNQINKERKANVLNRKDIELLQSTKCVINDGQIKYSETKTLKHDLEQSSTLQQKIFQHVAKHYAKTNQPMPENVSKILADQNNPISLKNHDDFRNLIDVLEQFEIVHDDAHKIASDVLSESNTDIEKLKVDAEKLVDTKRKLEKLLKGPIADSKFLDSNFELKKLLRSAFENKAYQFLQECEDNPTIRFLHEINLAMYTETPLLSAYLSKDLEKPGLGNQIYKNAVSENELEEEKDQVDIVTKPGSFIDKMRHFAVKKGLYSSHSCLSYVISHFTQFFGAFASTEIGSYLFDYDPAGKLGNNVGALSNETLRVAGKPAKVIDVRTPSPTIGNKVSPEFRAALQAIENQKIAVLYGNPNKDGTKGYGRPNCWIYTNYQEITNSSNGENGRSVPIMNLNKEFPLSFKGITLSKDSEYFLDGLGHGSKMWDKIDARNETFTKDSVEDFIEDMKSTFSHEAHFTLDNRTANKGAGLYFPVSSDEEKETFKSMLDQIAMATRDLLNEALANKGECTGRDAWKLKVAAKEFAYAAIQGKIRNEELAEQAHNGIEEPKVVTTSACKEDIDRGFSDHVKRMWLSGLVGVKKLAKIISMPALMARFRVILDDRIQPLVALMDNFSREDAHKAYERAILTEGVFSTSWALNDKVSTANREEL